MRYATSIATFVTILSVARAFQTVVRQPTRVARVLPRLFESKEDEIAKLEEQLKRLKEEKEVEQAARRTATESVDVLEETPIEMFLTEQWKEQESTAVGDSAGVGLINVLFAVGAALVIIIFSQVPIGQEDLSKYSVGNSPVAEQIDLGDLNRARRSGDL